MSQLGIFSIVPDSNGGTVEPEVAAIAEADTNAFEAVRDNTVQLNCVITHCFECVGICLRDRCDFGLNSATIRVRDYTEYS